MLSSQDGEHTDTSTTHIRHALFRDRSEVHLLLLVFNAFAENMFGVLTPTPKSCADIRPSRHFIPARFSEVKTAPAEKREYGPDNCATCGLNSGLQLL